MAWLALQLLKIDNLGAANLTSKDNSRNCNANQLPGPVTVALNLLFDLFDIV
jgi:hypothetical protein